jgi:mono/diheme cytochrome c family protein
MRQNRYLKVGLGFFGLVVLLALLMALTLNSSDPSLAQDGPDQTEEPADDENGEVTPPDPNSEDIVERGEYLVRVEIACVGCHGASPDYKEDALGVDLIGGRAFELPFGVVYGPNLTVLSDWSAQEIENAIRYGVRPDGTVLLPPMSYHLHEGMADEDMDAIVAYLQSLEPVENEIPDAELAEDLTREMIRTVPEFDPEMEYSYPEDMEEDPLVRGTYMARHTSHCIACHGSVDENGMVIVDGPAAGEAIPDYPSLLEDDMQSWTDEELYTLLKEGIHPKQGGRDIFEMPTYSYQYMVDSDVEALIAWIRSQPSITEIE